MFAPATKHKMECTAFFNCIFTRENGEKSDFEATRLPTKEKLDFAKANSERK